MSDETAITKPNENAIWRPDFIPQNDTRGTDDLTKDDLQMPRLGLAQGLSPQIDPLKPEFIEGLRQGQMFNSLTKQIYAASREKPLKVVCIRRDPARYIEFIPRAQGGGIKDFNVAPNDARTQFGANGEPPVATKFYDYVLMFLETRELIALSLKSTGLKVGRNFNGLMKMRNAPVFTGVYNIYPVATQNQKGSFYTYGIENAGTQANPKAGWLPDPETYEFCEKLFNAFKNKAVKFEREPGDEDPNFVSEEMSEV